MFAANDNLCEVPDVLASVLAILVNQGLITSADADLLVRVAADPLLLGAVSLVSESLGKPA